MNQKYLMKLAQSKIRWLARLMLGLVLFAQGIVATSACVAPATSPVQAYSMMQQDDEAMPCHEDEVQNANACLAHCTQADQISADQLHLPIAAPVSVIAWVSSQPQTDTIRTFVFPEQLVLDTSPPIPIRFCTFLN